MKNPERNEIEMETKVKRIIILTSLLLTGLYAVKSNAGLIAYWKLDETTGSNVTDSSGNNNKGRLNGELVWAPAKGKYAGAVYFGKANNDYLEVPVTKLSVSQGTISLWANLDPDPQLARHRYLFGHGTSPYWTNRIQLYLRPEDPHLNLGFGDSHTLSSNIKALQPGTWYYIVLTWDHGNYLVYIDGIPEASGTYSGLEKLNSVADIGNDGRTDGTQRDESFNGLIDEVALFDHALSQNEVMQFYNGATDLFTSKPFLMLIDNIHQAGQINSPQETVDFLENKIAEYHQWERKNPKDMGSHHKRLSCELYFLLAKAKEAANAPAEQIVEAYKHSISQLQYRRNYVPALLWLFTNTSTDDYIDVVKISARSSNGVPENFHLIAKDFESSKNRAAFELFLKAVFAEVKDNNSFARAIRSGLNKEGQWYDSFLKYTRNKPQLRQFYIETFEKHAQEKFAQNEFMQAAEIYGDIINQCSEQQEKAAYRLKMFECLSNSGEYENTLLGLDDFINSSKATDKKYLAKAKMLKGQIYIQLNEINRACETFIKVIKEYPDTNCEPEAGFFIGYCNILKGNQKEAEESLKMVIKNYPQSSYARKAYLCLSKLNRAAD